MAIPKFEKLMYPLLVLAKIRGQCSMKNAEAELSKIFKLTEKERKQLKPSGRETTFFNRLRWARLYLRKAGLISDPEIGYIEITERGIGVIKLGPPGIDTKFLEQFSDFNEWQNKIKETKKISEQKSKPKTIKKKKGIVVLLDALGTKKKRTEEDEAKFIKDWTEFNQTFQNRLETILNPKKFKYVTFSDTILMYESSIFRCIVQALPTHLVR